MPVDALQYGALGLLGLVLWLLGGQLREDRRASAEAQSENSKLIRSMAQESIVRINQMTQAMSEQHARTLEMWQRASQTTLEMQGELLQSLERVADKLDEVSEKLDHLLERY